ncbi:MAG: hypothetical protein ABIS18_09465 [Actinomycetota bacterium]
MKSPRSTGAVLTRNDFTWRGKANHRIRYDDAMKDQMDAALAKSGAGDLEKLLFGGET